MVDLLAKPMESCSDTSIAVTAPVLIEDGADAFFDLVILVFCPSCLPMVVEDATRKLGYRQQDVQWKLWP